MDSSRVDLAALPSKVWKAKLAALRSHYATDDDPRVRECEAALSYHRVLATAQREVAGGHLDPGVIDVLAKYSRFYTPETSGPVLLAGPAADGGDPARTASGVGVVASAEAVPR